MEEVKKVKVSRLSSSMGADLEIVKQKNYEQHSMLFFEVNPNPRHKLSPFIYCSRKEVGHI